MANIMISRHIIDDFLILLKSQVRAESQSKRVFGYKLDAARFFSGFLFLVAIPSWLRSWGDFLVMRGVEGVVKDGPCVDICISFSRIDLLKAV